jgi:septal ring factor EnvC (AmiA/AmiB activator)
MSDETDDDLVERLKNAERELRNAEAKLVKITSERKVAKELVADLQFELRKLTGELAEPKAMPLFDDDDDEEDEELFDGDEEEEEVAKKPAKKKATA